VQIQSFTAQHSWPAAAAPNHDEMPIFWVDDRLRPCKHISLMFPSHIINAELNARVGKQQRRRHTKRVVHNT
jgi:hypothetical protein